MTVAQRRWLRRTGILLIAIVAVAYFAGRGRRTSKPVQANVQPGIPVVGATAQKGNLPIYLNGLGSVVPINTVTVRTRVDGELMRVYVVEGQTVQAGEVIAEIDPRPFQVQLEQAQGQLQRDEAALANARIDLERYRILAAQDSIPKQQYDTQIATV